MASIALSTEAARASPRARAPRPRRAAAAARRWRAPAKMRNIASVRGSPASGAVEHRQVAEDPAVDVEQRHAQVAHGAHLRRRARRPGRAAARCRGCARAAGLRTTASHGVPSMCVLEVLGTHSPPSQNARARRRRDSGEVLGDPGAVGAEHAREALAPASRRSARRSRWRCPRRSSAARRSRRGRGGAVR